MLATQIAKIQIETDLYQLTLPLTKEDNFFGILSSTGKLTLCNFQLIDTKNAYLKYLKALRK